MPWTVLFHDAFDPSRRAIVLVGGNKAGIARDRFYRPLIRRADERFDNWLEAEDKS